MLQLGTIPLTAISGAVVMLLTVLCKAAAAPPRQESPLRIHNIVGHGFVFEPLRNSRNIYNSEEETEQFFEIVERMYGSLMPGLVRTPGGPRTCVRGDQVHADESMRAKRNWLRPDAPTRASDRA